MLLGKYGLKGYKIETKVQDTGRGKIESLKVFWRGVAVKIRIVRKTSSVHDLDLKCVHDFIFSL